MAVKTRSSPRQSGGRTRRWRGSAARRRVNATRWTRRVTCSPKPAPGSRLLPSTRRSHDSAECFAQQYAAFANHRRVAAKRESQRVGARHAERITGRAANALLGKQRRQRAGIGYLEPLVDRRVELHPDVEGTARREGTHTADAAERPKHHLATLRVDLAHAGDVTIASRHGGERGPLREAV